MNPTDPESSTWFPELCERVHREISRLSQRRKSLEPSVEHELATVHESIEGFDVSLRKPTLDPMLRAEIEEKYAAALKRRIELENCLAEQSAIAALEPIVLDARRVAEKLRNLGAVLAGSNPTRANIELSLHIDRVECYDDGKVSMRTCKLGLLNGAVGLLQSDAQVPAPSQKSTDAIHQAQPRRRARLRTDNLSAAAADEDLEGAAFFAGDPDRFAGLADEFFWIDEFQMPGPKRSWAQQNAESVFRRRIESHLPCAALAEEFEVTPATIMAAIRQYLKAHPGESDIVLRKGGRRRPKFDLTKLGPDAKRLWLDGWPIERIAAEKVCSPPTIVKAIQWAYEQEGQSMPTRDDLNREKWARARKIFDETRSIRKTADQMRVTIATVREYLDKSFAAEGATRPDLRTREYKNGAHRG